MQGLINVKFVAAARWRALTPDGVLISEGEAKRRDLALGGVLMLRVDGTPLPLDGRGRVRDDRPHPRGAHLRPRHVHEHEHHHAGRLRVAHARRRASATRSSAPSSARPPTDYGIGELQDKQQFIDSRADLVDRSLAFIYGLLLLSIMIATFGIVITLLLAVYERRREIGLLRAVGMTRAQVRTTVRWESVITSVYGAFVGVLMGLVLGYVVIVALRDQGLHQVLRAGDAASCGSSCWRSSPAWPPR